MRKLVKRLAFIALAAIISFSMAACIINMGNDTGGNTSGDSNPFNGTTWSGYLNPGRPFTVRFTSNTSWEMAYDNETSGGTYTYNGNTATLRTPNSNNDFATAEISGSNLTFIDLYSGDTFTLTRGSGGGGSKPSAPTGVTAAPYYSSGIRITWNAVSGATSYTVYWGASANGTYHKLKDTTSTSYIDDDVTPGDRYYYKVTASNSYGESPMSDYDYATAPGSGEASVFYPIASGE
jgi:hypothetical protein